MIAAVIMAGGAGTRFWPLSTEERPKQFLTLFGERSLLQMSYDRIAPLASSERTLVLTNERFVPLVREQLPGLPLENIIGEPHRRDTAGAVALAAFICQARFGNPTMVVLAADHVIEPAHLFQQAVLSAARGAEDGEGALYTFGVQPSYPATGYGYLQLGEKVLADDGVEHFQLLCFREKPDAATARKYLDSGSYLWNSGMFVWTTASIIQQLGRHLPGHLRLLQPAVEKMGSPAGDEALRAAFQQLTTISIDFGVMEKAGPIRCVSSTFDWSDVGGWLALEGYLPRDDAGNLHRGQLRCLSAQDNLVFCDREGELVALVGVKDLIVVRAGDRTLIVDRHRAEEVKSLVLRLEAKHR